MVPPRNKNGILGEILPLAGAVVGGVIGGGASGGAGALSGAGAGYGLGSAASNLLGANQQQQLGVQQAGGGSALERRQIQLNQPDNLTALRNAEAAAAYLPERQRQSYLPAIVTARRLEEQQRGMV
jgi:hypothetical protein